MENQIMTYVVNLKNRIDRKSHIIVQFKNEILFNTRIISAIQHESGAQGLWQTFQRIVLRAKNKNVEYFIFCEDDHQFTQSYTSFKLERLIAEANQKEADILLGGISWCKTAIQVSNDLFWIDKFSGLQFTVIFNRFYNKILSADFKNGDAADYKISELSNNKLVIFPFISTQKEFGYSDVTKSNDQKGYVTAIFKKTSSILAQLIKVKNYYQPLSNVISDNLTDGYDYLTIPTYIINLPERTDRLHHIEKQFKGRNEFELTIVEACRHKTGAVGLWKSIVKVINTAIQNEDDVIIICEDDHEFTIDYTKEYLIRNIIEASEQGADILSGGAGSFGQAVPITKERYWINPMFSTQFIVVYAKFFQQILDYKFKQNDTADEVISKLTSHKMLLFPYVSVQKDFGYSDITQSHNDHPGLVSKMFNDSQLRLQSMNEAYCYYNLDEHE